jgi:hypothetical protein
MPHPVTCTTLASPPHETGQCSGTDCRVVLTHEDRDNGVVVCVECSRSIAAHGEGTMLRTRCPICNCTSCVLVLGTYNIDDENNDIYRLHEIAHGKSDSPCDSPDVAVITRIHVSNGNLVEWDGERIKPPTPHVCVCDRTAVCANWVTVLLYTPMEPTKGRAAKRAKKTIVKK